jgi:hypothetical protein
MVEKKLQKLLGAHLSSISKNIAGFYTLIHQRLDEAMPGLLIILNDYYVGIPTSLKLMWPSITFRI